MLDYSRKVQRSKDRRAIRRTLGQWLESFDWDWFATFTFQGEFTPEAGRRAIKNYFDRLERRLRKPLPRFWVQEYGKVIEFGPHFHSLIANVNSTPDSAKIAWELWKLGRMETKPYRSWFGASEYLTKYVSKANFDKSDWGVDKLGHLSYNLDR